MSRFDRQDWILFAVLGAIAVALLWEFVQIVAKIHYALKFW